jgi:hypothetical protein
MTWLTIIKYARLAAAWCKNHWRWLLAFSVLIFVYSLGRKGAAKVKLEADQARDDWKKEKEAIERSHELEIQKREEANKRYSDAVRKIEERYEKDKLNITRSRKEEIKALAKKAKNDPDEIDRILEQELGIKKVDK